MSQDTSPAFAQFLKEIQDHFAWVLREQMRWTVLDEPQYIQGNGNVVVRFRTADGMFIFRVPKFSQHQLRSVALAYRHFGELGIMPELIYKDGKCMLERYAEGIPLSAGASDATLQAVARVLARMHTIPATAFGRLTHGTTGMFASLDDWLAQSRFEFPGRFSVDADEDELSAEEARVLDAMAQQLSDVPSSARTAALRVTHGDLWRRNVVIGMAPNPGSARPPEGVQSSLGRPGERLEPRVTFIDWDNVGAYPREGDLVVMVDAGLDARQKALFLEAYGDDTLDLDMITWLSLRRIARSSTDTLRQKIAKARHYDLLR